MKKSTLQDAQNAAAQQCTQNSLQGTSFRVDRGERLEGAADEFVVRLSLPVPFPADGSQVSAEATACLRGFFSGSSVVMY